MQLLGSALNQTLIVGLSLEDAGANRPAHLPARPAPGTYIEEEDNSDDFPLWRPTRPVQRLGAAGA